MSRNLYRDVHVSKWILELAGQALLFCAMYGILRLYNATPYAFLHGAHPFSQAAWSVVIYALFGLWQSRGRTTFAGRASALPKK